MAIICGSYGHIPLRRGQPCTKLPSRFTDFGKRFLKFWTVDLIAVAAPGALLSILICWGRPDGIGQHGIVHLDPLSR
jgi:hypothetical protein